jgi:hypothetical protein
MSDVPVAEIILNEPRIVIAIREIVAGRVAEHVGMDVETQLGAFARLGDEVYEGNEANYVRDQLHGVAPRRNERALL